MYGAILGDIIGSVFEFDRGPWTKDFELFTKHSSFTDDTVMTVAIAEALMSARKDADLEAIKKECIASMKKWGQWYPNAGYGTRFYGWVLTDNPKPYGSFGNGSAMRVSAAGWLYDSIERTREVARVTAEVTHNHPEGIKGAECTAAVMYLARTGKNKEEIKEYVAKEFGYDISESLEEIRKHHRHVETCMDSIPKALVSFFEGDSYEDVVRNAVSLGGDTDTIAAIAGAMAEAMYGMPIVLQGECKMRVDKEMLDVIDKFDKTLGRYDESANPYEKNAILEAAYVLFMEEEDENEKINAFYRFMTFLSDSMADEAVVPMPFVDVNNILQKNIDIEQVKLGDEVLIEDEVRLRMDTMQDSDGNLWLPLFITDEELCEGKTANIIMPIRIYDVFKSALEGDDLQGVVINPFNRPMPIDKEVLKTIIGGYEVWLNENEK